MSNTNYPKEFIELLQSVKGKRPKTVIDHRRIQLISATLWFKK